jgi:carboxypeptidase family protein
MRMFIIAALLGALLPDVALAQQPSSPRHEIVRGRVRSDSGLPVRAADVVVTRTSDALSRTTSTDSAGAFQVDFATGNGDYALSVTAPGFKAYSAHLLRASSDTIFADVRLTRSVQRLAAVVSRATRPVPDRDPASYDAAAVGGSAFAQNAARRLAPDQAGDFTAIASLMPGVAVTPAGISVAGLPSSQNTITMGGLAFAGTDVPRDAITRIRVQSSSYDPAMGWYSGAITAADLAVGDQFTSRSGHLSIDAPSLQYNDPVSARLGQQFTNFNASLGGNGQLVDDRWAYNYGLQGGRRASSLSATVVDAGPSLLQHAGVAADSAARLIALLGTAGVPTSLGSLPPGTIDESFSFIGRVDHAPFDWNTMSPNATTYGLQGYGKWHRGEAIGFTPTATPGHGGTSGQDIGALTALFSNVSQRGFLTDLRSGITAVRSTSDPYLAMPDGRVLVASTFPGADPAVSTLQFGGNSALSTIQRNFRWESLGSLQLYPPGAVTHRVKIAADLRYDAFSQDLTSNRLGTYTFNSLADLAANQPAAFTRTLSAPSISGGEWNAFIAAGDLWRVAPQWQVIYGLRAEGNAFTSRPVLNPSLASALGIRNDRVPATLALSPRLAVNWQDGKGKVIRAGAGQFRNITDASLLSVPLSTTGLPGGVSRISCIGAAVPSPDWSTFATDPSAIPTQCVNSSSAFVDASPGVQYIDRSFQPTRSWRGNLGYQSSILHNVYSIDLVGSWNLDQPGTFDRNFGGAPAFTVPNETRPVYVPASSIVATTGQLSPTLARITPDFGRVVDVVSDLHSVSEQAIVSLRPRIPAALQRYFGDIVLGYTLSDIRAQERGFDAGAFGDPRTREWSRGDLDARHLFVVQGVFRPLGDGRLLAFFSGRAQSGLPFTPMIAGDVNGDGLPNDRAFVFTPSATTDTALANGLRSLLATAPRSVRNCLDAQIGRAAARNSCEGPWTESLNIGVRMSGQLLHTPRMDVTINLANPLGGLDQLIHGSNNLRGWGAPATPDPTLYTVRGFDAAANRFLYTVNPRFGTSAPSIGTLRAPFRLTLDVQLDLARSVSDQQLDRWLRPGRAGRSGQKLTEKDFFRRYQRTVPDPYAELLQQSDSLLLSSSEIGQLQAAQSAYRTRVDAMWSSLASYLAGLPDTYDVDAVSRRTDETIDDVWEVTRIDVQKNLEAILAPAQSAMLTGWSGMLFRAHDRVHIRLSPRGG